VSAVRWIGLWGPVAGFMVALFLVSAQPSPATAEQVWDKLLHAGAYAVFGFFCLRATHGGLARPRPAPILWALLLTAGYGAFDEWHQSWVPGRHPSVADWVADLVGAMIALALFLAWARLAPSRK